MRGSDEAFWQIILITCYYYYYLPTSTKPKQAMRPIATDVVCVLGTHIGARTVRAQPPLQRPTSVETGEGMPSSYTLPPRRLLELESHKSL